MKPAGRVGQGFRHDDAAMPPDFTLVSALQQDLLDACDVEAEDGRRMDRYDGDPPAHRILRVDTWPRPRIARIVESRFVFGFMGLLLFAPDPRACTRATSRLFRR